jgi:superfamily II DNA or RNA helicase/HKD family nuclease
LDALSTPAEKVLFVNRLVALMDPKLVLEEKPQALLAILLNEFDGKRRIETRPHIPLNELALLTNAPNEPRLGAALNAELVSADGVDILMSFIKKSGVKVLEGPLRDLADRGVPIRVVTTTYVGVTDREAVDRLVNEFGANVRISFESHKDRLHAKAWLIRRSSGFSSAFVGSSNVSGPALNDGTEWNVRLTEASHGDVYRKFQQTFNAYWESGKFLDYVPSRDAEKLDQALEWAAFGSQGRAPATIFTPAVEVTPYRHQVRMLEDLEIERSIHGRRRNLVVAATGTGKTVLAALDYKRMCLDGRPRPSLLFVAHKREILEQAAQTFREVLRDGSFGELFVDGQKPSAWRHIFASVQSISSRDIQSFDPGQFEIVVIDEFHHAEAKTYRRVIDHLRPLELLGLTATPERSDGKNVQDEFFDGHIATELRLWDALDEGLLVPFSYFGIADGTDLRSIRWSRGRYDSAELGLLLSRNEGRAERVLEELSNHVSDLGTARILGFCVDKTHAIFMADFFSRHGVSAKAIISDSSALERDSAKRDLASGNLRAIFAVDIFNEGVDIPSIDTLLFLRPTESPVLFLQQFGRGLRLSSGKSELTVLDFIGAQRAEYRLDIKFTALTSYTKAELKRQLDSGFPYLPSGCSIVLDRQSADAVIGSLKGQINTPVAKLGHELRAQGDVSLNSFLEEQMRDIVDVYGKSRSWTEVRRAAGFIHGESTKFERKLIGRMNQFLHCQDPERNDFYRSLCEGPPARWGALERRDQVLTAMFFWNLYPDARGLDGVKLRTYDEGLELLQTNRIVVEELLQVLSFARSGISAVPQPLSGSLQAMPLYSHVRYTRAELLAAVNYAQLEGQGIWPGANKTRAATGQPAGVYFSKELQTDLLFVNLKKDETHFSPSTMYRDFAISQSKFHWETQNATGPDTPTGRRYLAQSQGDSNVLLATRMNKFDEIGTAAFTLLGKAQISACEGAFPMQVTLELERRMPLSVFEGASIVD